MALHFIITAQPSLVGVLLTLSCVLAASLPEQKKDVFFDSFMNDIVHQSWNRQHSYGSNRNVRSQKYSGFFKTRQPLQFHHLLQDVTLATTSKPSTTRNVTTPVMMTSSAVPVAIEMFSPKPSPTSQESREDSEENEDVAVFYAKRPVIELRVGSGSDEGGSGDFTSGSGDIIDVEEQSGDQPLAPVVDLVSSTTETTTVQGLVEEIIVSKAAAPETGGQQMIAPETILPLTTLPPATTPPLTTTITTPTTAMTTTTKHTTAAATTTVSTTTYYVSTTPRESARTSTWRMTPRTDFDAFGDMRCDARPDPVCCKGRDDSESCSIKKDLPNNQTGICYCDEHCLTVSENFPLPDCCPDFLKTCGGPLSIDSATLVRRKLGKRKLARVRLMRTRARRLRKRMRLRNKMKLRKKYRKNKKNLSKFQKVMRAFVIGPQD